jgi:hypothetical protein
MIKISPDFLLNIVATTLSGTLYQVKNELTSIVS